jgi:hypothetical protein
MTDTPSEFAEGVSKCPGDWNCGEMGGTAS